MGDHHHHDLDFDWQVLIHGHDDDPQWHGHVIEDSFASMRFGRPCFRSGCLDMRANAVFVGGEG